MGVSNESLCKIADIVALRRDRFGLIASVFSRESSEEAVACMTAQAADLQLDLDESAEFGLHRRLAALSFDGLSAFATLTRTEYARLFLGPREVVAPLHESAYLSGTSRMFTAETLAVRAVYERNGYIMKAKNREPEDGVGTEFEFLRNLCDRCLALLKCGPSGECDRRDVQAECASENLASADSAEFDVREFVRLMRLQESFEEQHMRRWMHMFAQRVEENDRSGFYAAWASYLLDVLDEDDSLMGECLGLLGDAAALHADAKAQLSHFSASMQD